MNNKNIVTKSGNVTYYVNREKKTVVALIRCDMETPLYIFDRALDKLKNTSLISIGFENFNIRNAIINERYVGVARCHESDTFDEEFGKKLALARAKAKKAYAVNASFFEFVEQLDKVNYVVGKKSDELYRRWLDFDMEVDNLLMSIIKE